MSPQDLLGSLPALAVTALVGRAWLAALPPGDPGRHAARDLPTTWAASHALGLSTWLVIGSLASAGGAPLALTLWILPAALLAGVRLLTAPGAMVPRQEAARAAEGMGARLLLGVAVAALASALARTPLAPPAQDAGLPLGALVEGFGAAPSAALLAWAPVAAVVLIGHGLRIARRDAAARRGVQCILALAFLGLGERATSPALATTTLLAMGAAAGAVSWLRRADRRGAWLAALLFAGLGFAHPAAGIWAALTLGVLDGASAPAGRRLIRRTARPAGALLVIAAWPSWLLCAAVPLCIALGHLIAARVAPRIDAVFDPQHPGRALPPRRELLPVATLSPLGAPALLLLALAFARAEDPPPGTPRT